MNKETLIALGVFGIVLFLLFRYAKPQTSVVPQLVGVGSVGGSDSSQVDPLPYAANAFDSLASLANSAISADTEEKMLSAQLEAENIRLFAQKDVLEQGLGLARLQSEAEERIIRLQSENSVQLAGIAKDVELARFGAVSAVSQAELNARQRQLETQIGAVQSVANQYRNQSLERAGSYLNALLSSFGAQPTYDYQSAFGGPRQNTLATILNGAAGLISPLRGLFG